MFSRSQIEWAIAKLSGQEGGGPPTLLRSQLKRLLLFDRTMPVDRKSARTPIRKNYAFFGSEMPGTGIAVDYTKKDAFMLALGHKALQLGWKPSFIVPTFRIYRDVLCKEFDRLTCPEANIQFRKGTSKAQETAWLESGMSVEDQESLSWLATTNTTMPMQIYRKGNPENDSVIEPANIAKTSAELTDMIAYLNRIHGPAIVFDLCNPAISINYLLDRAPIQSRGRPRIK